jgi:hypothetical protein
LVPNLAAQPSSHKTLEIDRDPEDGSFFAATTQVHLIPRLVRRLLRGRCWEIIATWRTAMISRILMSAVLLVGVSSIAVAQSTSQPPVAGSGTTVPGAGSSGSTLMNGQPNGVNTSPGISGSSTDSTSINKQSTGATGMPKTGTAEPAGSGTSMGGSTTNPTVGGSK